MNSYAIPRNNPALVEPSIGGGLNSLGVFFLMVFLFLAHSRVGDLYLSGLRIPLVTSLLAFAVAVFAGGLPRALFSRQGYWLTAFSIWLIVAVPFSFWPGGSVQLLTEQWIKSFLVFVIVAGLLRTTRQCQLAMYAIGVADIAIVVMSFGSGAEAVGGRLSLQQGVLSNPNDLAQLLLIGLPFLFLVGWNGNSLIVRAVVAVCIIGVLIVVAKTGSRGAAVTVCAILIVVLIRSSWPNRVKLICALILAAVMVLPILSDDQWARYSTLLSDAPSVQGRDDPVGSTQARIELLRQSAEITFDHPMFGIGPGIFQVASAEYSARRGERGAWHDTHNTYTQVSSEAGLPGLLLFTGVLFTSLRSSHSVYAAAREKTLVRLSNTAYCLWLSLIIYAVSVNFSSIAYHHHLPMLAALAVALQMSSRQQVADVRTDRLASVQSPVLRPNIRPLAVQRARR